MVGFPTENISSVADGVLLYLNVCELNVCFHTNAIDHVAYCLLYRVIENDCRGFNNLSHTIHL